MRRLVLAELVVLAAALLLLLLVLLHHCCRCRWSGGKGPPLPTRQLPVSDPTGRKERRRERLRRALLRLCSRRSRVEPATASAATSPDAQGVAAPEQQQQQPAAAAGAEEGVAAWRERWFGGPGSRALYTIDEESSSTSSWTPTAASEGDAESQCGGGGERQEPETPFYTPPASPQRDAEIS